MKLNYRNTALSLLDNMNPSSFTICEDAAQSPIEYKRALGLSIIREWPKIKDDFASKIRYISNPFHDAYLLGKHRIADVIDEEPIDERGTLISKAGNEYNTIFYRIKTTGKDADFRMYGQIFFFTNWSSKEKPSLGVFIQRLTNGDIQEYISATGAKAGVTHFSIFCDILSLILFLKYCDLETKEIKAGKKDVHIGTKYLNETNHKIEILDSTWFTTIVRSEGFHVRGHFRMQPFKTGPKLIWISDFDKTGYTRKAKILNQQI